MTPSGRARLSSSRPTARGCRYLCCPLLPAPCPTHCLYGGVGLRGCGSREAGRKLPARPACALPGLQAPLAEGWRTPPRLVASFQGAPLPVQIAPLSSLPWPAAAEPPPAAGAAVRAGVREGPGQGTAGVYSQDVVYCWNILPGCTSHSPALILLPFMLPPPARSVPISCFQPFLYSSNRCRMLPALGPALCLPSLPAGAAQCRLPFRARKSPQLQAAAALSTE